MVRLASSVYVLLLAAFATAISHPHLARSIHDRRLLAVNGAHRKRCAPPAGGSSTAPSMPPGAPPSSSAPPSYVSPAASSGSGDGWGSWGSSASSYAAPAPTPSASSPSGSSPSAPPSYTPATAAPPADTQTYPPTTSAPAPQPTYTPPAQQPSSAAPASPAPSPSEIVAAVSGATSFLSGVQSGQGTYYSPGLGACGITSSDSDYIVAVSHLLFDEYPGYNGGDPNSNPVCGMGITASYGGKSVSLKVVDRCTGCALTDLDLSPSAFSALASESVGRINLTWQW